jgi:hypothetical protein
VYAPLQPFGNRMKRRRVYISGPLFSSGDVEQNVATAMELTLDLIAAGYAPLCPHLAWYLDQDQDIPHHIWIEVDLAWVEMSQAVLRIPGSSSGADQECRHAFNLGIPIYNTLDELRANL